MVLSADAGNGLRGRFGRLPGRGFVVSMGSSMLRLAIQLGQFVLVARALGPTDYGLFAGLVGLCASLSAIAGWGAGTLYVRDVAKQGLEHDMGLLARSLWMFVPSSVLLAGATVAGVALLSNGMDLASIVAIIAADLIFGAFTQVVIRMLLAGDNFNRVAIAEFSFSGTRLLAAAIFFLAGLHSAQAWADFYLGASIVSAGISLVLMHGRQALFTRPTWRGGEFRDGFAFAWGQGAQQARRNLDKPLALVALGPELAGVFAAASRFVEAALLPMFSMLRVTQRRFFAAAADGWGEIRRFLLTMLPLVAGMGLALAVALVGLAFTVQWLLGPQYAGTAPILVALALLPGLNGAAAVASDALSARNRQSVRLFVETAGCGLKALLCLALGAAFGMPGFLAGLIATDVIVAIVLLTMALRHRAEPTS